MNIIDYIKKHKNEDFKQFKFTEVDNLIFSTLPYIDFTGIIPAFTGKKILLKDVAKAFKDHSQRGGFLGNTYKMLQIMADSKRYGDALLYNYMNIVNDEMQFGAISIKLNDNSIFVAFAGTDTSIIGWEEDFKMAYLYPGASQKYAAIYLNKAIRLFDTKVRVGGHSKGGNLAICATMNSNFYIRKKVIAIYNNDGPGFLKDQVNSKKYKKINHKIKMFVPEQSIIGMILYHQEEYTVVKAKGFSILQHDAFNWLCDTDSFVKSKLNKRSKNLEIRITKKLEEMPTEKRLDLVKNIFDVFKNNAIKDTKDIKLKKLLQLIKSFSGLDKETKNLLLELLMIIFIK